MATTITPFSCSSTATTTAAITRSSCSSSSSSSESGFFAGKKSAAAFVGNRRKPSFASASSTKKKMFLRAFARKTSYTAHAFTAARREVSSVSSPSSSSLVFRQKAVRDAKSSSLLKAVADPSKEEVGVEPIPLLTSDESEDLLKIRHSTAHI